MNRGEWTSNSDEFTRFIPAEDRSTCQLTKVLGHIWNIKKDSISLNYTDMSTTKKQEPAKRIVLKTIASFFYPQGFLLIIFTYYIVLHEKLMLQSLWSKALNLDDEISSLDLIVWSERNDYS